ncbi:PepSY domain-containing protein [Methylobacterium gossipiicola]|uniref:Peptidase propeptide and YPEB domain-containing protein n=1 Tax=Methylobacterium gossipiicola TaxID=582675 RepID=A0A1I2QEQ9_9HYPH|nr:PepSY domain-containing protein [Methylobacterium gossipiicola]SFG26123.1 Peptidase propeptide and YPEB domain-containing protein [Methylobacterium gossipiicola]
MQSVSKLLVGSAFAMALGLAAAPAFAQGISIGPGGVQVDPGYRRGYDDRGPPRSELTRGEATRIARREGLADVDGVERRGPRMIVRGSDRRGDDISVVIDSRSGDVIDVRR